MPTCNQQGFPTGSLPIRCALVLLVQGSNLQLHCTANKSNNVPVRAQLECTNRRATYMLFLNLCLAAGNSGYACCTHGKHDLTFCFPLTLRSHPGSGKAPVRQALHAVTGPTQVECGSAAHESCVLSKAESKFECAYKVFADALHGVPHAHNKEDVASSPS